MGMPGFHWGAVRALWWDKEFNSHLLVLLDKANSTAFGVFILASEGDWRSKVDKSMSDDQ